MYQDLFAEGSFIGKGIYDVDCFDRCTRDLPDNAILSHDLIEGAHCRSALLSDVTLYEEYPSRYGADVARRHRWIRGDWQISGWLLPWVRGRSGRRIRNTVSMLSRWKIFDNLRRSLVPPAMLLTLLISWSLSPAIAGAALLFLVSVVLVPRLLAFVADLLQKPVDLPLRMHIRVKLQSLKRPLAQSVLTFVFLPYEAYNTTNAILRTLVRMCWTKRRLLEWRTASDTERGSGGQLTNTFLSMVTAPALATLAILTLALYHREMLPIAGPLIALWLVSPLVAWWLSLPIPRRVPRFSKRQHHFLQLLTRKTWRYFEEFVTAKEHYLPPDNIQQNPELVIAPRTSPTNIGMALLCNLGAYDFGYCSAGQFLTRTRHTFETLSHMERYRGHFFNWYNTRSLAPLHPRYISMVDSGNLVANLLVLSSGCEELSTGPILPPRMFGGLSDTLRALLEVARAKERPLVGADLLRKIERQLEDLDRAPSVLTAANALLSQLSLVAAELTAAAVNDAEYAWWANAYERSCHDHQTDLVHLAGWLTLRPPPEGFWENGPSEHVARLGILQEILKRLDIRATLRDVAEVERQSRPLIETLLDDGPAESKDWLMQLNTALATSSKHAIARIQSFEELSLKCRELADMDFDLLYDSTRDLFVIGYNVSEARYDASYYDLLASEARLGSFIVIAQGQFGQQHWFALSRLLTSAGHMPALLSWSGSMFEYLMPLLVMPNYEHTLLDRTYHAAVRRQIEYGRQRGVPWGISESGYNAIDQHKTYQYRAFGVPGMGLKRGLAEDLVIAPYASVLALMVAPEAACHNLERLTTDGQQGSYGLYEAVDYTPSRLPLGVDRMTVRQFMAHHAGMSLLSLAYVLLDKPMQRRFLADPMLRAAELLLQERIPKATAPVFPHTSEASATQFASGEETGTMRVFTDPNSPAVEAHLLSNGRYHVAVTSAGGGYSRSRDLAVTRSRRRCHARWLRQLLLFA